MRSRIYLLLPFVCAGSFLAADVGLETTMLGFRVSPERGTAELIDRAAGVTWMSRSGRLGEVTLIVDGKPRRIDLREPRATVTSQFITFDFQPLTNNPARLRVVAETIGTSTLQLTWEADASLNVEGIRLLDDLLTTTGNGYVVVPVREGLFVPANSGRTFTNRFDTYAYEGCHMAMFGVVRDGAAALITWADPYPVLELRSTIRDPAPQVIAASLSQRKTSRSFRICVLGKTDYSGIAQAYRDVVRDNGWLVTWDEKLKGSPDRAKLFGASNFKLWSMLTRRMSEDSSKELSARVSWTFDEAAQVAEHLKNDLKLDKVLFTMGGWIHRGYDNQHPDILPTAPELGGDAAFASSTRRIMDLGYLLCLHDNYQDIYRDSPSWDERYVQRTANGGLTKGGHWAGGVAYITCAKMAMELAQRPQNLTAVKKLSNANSYFIDTTYAAGLQECFDKDHPLTRADDMKWKQALSDYSRKVFGVFGSECGREWAIPHADFFEGLTGVSGKFYHSLDHKKLGATSVPLFEMVYRDTIALYGKYGYDPASAAEYVLHHIMLGRPMHYHNVPAHLYWKNGKSSGDPLPLTPSISEFKQTAPREFSLSYRWNVNGPVAGDFTIFVHFTDSKGKIVFQGDHSPTPSLREWKQGEVTQQPRAVKVPAGLEGNFDIRIGLFDPESGARQTLPGRDDGEQRYILGRVKVSGDTVQFEPATRCKTPEQLFDRALFCRADGGWADGMHRYDRFLKNTHEVLSPLNEITSRVPMTRHEFLTPDRKVQRSIFGNGAVTVVVNAGTTEFPATSKSGGAVLLPPGGFLVDAPQFVAFHALSWNGLTYDSAPLFTLRGGNDEPLATAKSVQVYHAFGPPRIRIGRAIHAVAREATIQR